MIDFSSHSARTLLALARRQSGIDSDRCDCAFAHLLAAEQLRSDLRSALARHRLSDLQFAILVSLVEADPETIPMATLAHRAGVSRSAVTEAFDALLRSGLANRARDKSDRRIIYGEITTTGRETIHQAINDYLRIVAQAPAPARPFRP
ncbi:MAG: MarR family transcriptional regulator [Candidatus Didemnitutus sp.]|nr:MarR family transcriptional regulator [Candidatus Didemnitutus sp.]